tara:strand:+ start:1352 stop:2011 length:660 start_codon:yes stop_codon:yes gene_type:complete
MHESVQKLIYIEKLVKSKIVNSESLNTLTIIAVSKTFPLKKIMPLINHGHKDYGENKVQEAVEKWSDIKIEKSDLRLHLLGKLQTNKVKVAIRIFDFIHSVDNKKLAKKIADEQLKLNKKVKIFIQVNLGEEEQKSGISKNNLKDFYLYCKDLKLDVIGLMCIPPINQNPTPFFQELDKLNISLNLKELSMGMSSDYIEAVENSSTYIRIGSAIFGQRA